jgi:hypothetical protein
MRVRRGKEEVAEGVEEEMANTNTLKSKLDWIDRTGADREVTISRVLLTDRETLLVGSF